MKKLITASIFALSMTASGIAMAQTTPSRPPATPPAATAPTTGAPTVAMDPAVEAKFKAADKSGKGVLEGAALEPYKPVLTKVDTDKDGKISRAEFAAAARAGIIK